MKDPVSYEDFSKIEFRVGKVAKAENKEGSENLIRLTVYFGEVIGQRNILSGVAKRYKPEDLEGKKFIFIVNLEPKKMMGEESQGMMFCAVDDDGTPVMIPVSKKIKEGTVVR